MKVSVLCTAYNHEKYIRSALEGILSQKTDFDYEVLVHDDASTDGTAGIIREYAERYPQIIKPIYQTENQYSKRRDLYLEILIPQATGTYIAVCEGDDYWIDENKLQMQVDFLEQNSSYAACVHNCYKLDVSTGSKTVMYGEADYDIRTSDVLVGGSCCYQTASLLCRREAFFDLPPFVPGFFDYPFSIHLSLLGPIRFLGRIMSVYRVGTESSWTTANKKNMHKNAMFHSYVSQMLQSVNDYTDHAYDRQIRELVCYNNYKALYFDEKYSEMRAPEYRELYSRESRTSKIKMWLKQYLAPLYHVYRRLKY